MRGIKISSIARAVMAPAAVVYHETKGSVDAIPGTLAKELETKISVNGLIRTNQPRGIRQ